MITVKEFKKMILNNCPENWTILLSKWEHGNTEDFMKRNYPMPNLVSVKINEVTSRYNDLGGRIFKFIFEDDFDDDFKLNRDEFLKCFTNDLNNNDILEFVLYTEDTPGHYNHIDLDMKLGDKSYSDKIMIFDLEEK